MRIFWPFALSLFSFMTSSRSRIASLLFDWLFILNSNLGPRTIVRRAARLKDTKPGPVCETYLNSFSYAQSGHFLVKSLRNEFGQPSLATFTPLWLEYSTSCREIPGRLEKMRIFASNP